MIQAAYHGFICFSLNTKNFYLMLRLELKLRNWQGKKIYTQDVGQNIVYSIIIFEDVLVVYVKAVVLVSQLVSLFVFHWSSETLLLKENILRSMSLVNYRGPTEHDPI